MHVRVPKSEKAAFDKDNICANGTSCLHTAPLFQGVLNDVHLNSENNELQMVANSKGSAFLTTMNSETENGMSV